MVKAQVLIVDDQEGIRQLLHETCHLLGYKALTAKSGVEALALAQKHDFQLALVDLKMPGLDGFSTMERLLAVENRLNLIAMSGYGEMELNDFPPHLKVAAIMKKPFDLMELKSLLEKTLGK